MREQESCGRSVDMVAVPAQGRITLVQAQQPAFQFPILLPAQRGFAAQPFVIPLRETSSSRHTSSTEAPARAAVRIIPVLVLYGLESMPTDF